MSKYSLSELNLARSGSVLHWQRGRNLPQENASFLLQVLLNKTASVLVMEIELVFSKVLVFQSCDLNFEKKIEEKYIKIV